MSMFILQSALLILIAFILGALLGALLRKLFANPEQAPAQIAQPPSPEPVTQSEPVKKSLSDKVPAKKTATRKSPAKKSTKRTPPVKKPAVAAKDDLKKISGIGPQNEKKLNAIGITTFEQMAKWTAKTQREIGERLSFAGRIEREEWVKQAKILAKGGETEFSKRKTK